MGWGSTPAIQKISVCGLVCSSCSHYLKSECKGCHVEKGRLYWFKDDDECAPRTRTDAKGRKAKPERCPIYICCVRENELENCGHCPKLPCDRFLGFGDPKLTPEENKRIKEQSVNRLRGLVERKE